MSQELMSPIVRRLPYQTVQTLGSHTYAIPAAAPSKRNRFWHYSSRSCHETTAPHLRHQRQLLLQHVKGRVLSIGDNGNDNATARLQNVQYADIDNLQQQYPHDHFDWIILNNALCKNAASIMQVLQTIHNILKPGGYVFFSEHAAFGKGRKSNNTICCNWRRFLSSCNCSINILECIESMPEWDVVSWPMNNVTYMGATMVLGLAQKVQANI